MSVTVGRAKLKNAFQDLLVKWEETKAVWSDAQAEHIEKKILEPLDPQVRSALAAMDRLAAQITQAQRDCQ